MERGKRTGAFLGEIHLHEAIIQHIQSFLSCKEAAQTSILSKTWYNAWATRPILYLDQRHFQIRGGADPETLITDGFLEYSKKIMRRYEESNLKIESFRFCIENIETGCLSVVNELIVDGLKLGVCDLNVEIMAGTTKFDLPHEVLRSENLVMLSVSGCRIDLDALGGKLGFSKLKSLSLSRLCIVGFSTFDVASNCPLIEKLVLTKCTTVRISNDDRVETIALVLGSTADARFDNLKSLYLDMIVIDRTFFKDMSRSFPCLKDLTLNKCKCFLELQISSPSLEFLSISQMNVWDAKFDVPCLRKFTFSDTTIPSLSFEAASREWESYISITHMENNITTYWLNMLKNFLMKLRLSKISLYLRFASIRIRALKGFAVVGHVEGLPIPVVENLMLSMHYTLTSTCSSLLKGVFWTCRPKFITHGLVPEFCIGWEENSDILKLYCMSLIKRGSNGYCIPRQFMTDMYGLEKVDVEVFVDNLAEWQPLSWEALVDASESPGKKQQIRFKLGFIQNPSMHLDEIL